MRKSLVSCRESLIGFLFLMVCITTFLQLEVGIIVVLRIHRPTMLAPLLGEPATTWCIAKFIRGWIMSQISLFFGRIQCGGYMIPMIDTYTTCIPVWFLQKIRRRRKQVRIQCEMHVCCGWKIFTLSKLW